jgi:virginiamycin A acetyltransferase
MFNVKQAITTIFPFVNGIIDYLFIIKYKSMFPKSEVAMDLDPNAPRCDIKVGEYSHGTSIVRVRGYYEKEGNTYRIHIGKFNQIGTNVTLMPIKVHTPQYVSDNLHRLFINRTGHELYEKYVTENGDIEIGNDIWIGNDVKIIGHIKVGDGSIIGAGAIVTHDVPPYAIVAGSPARIVGYRFSRSQIKKLMRIKWWNWKDEKIKERLDSFYHVDEFLAKNKSNI